MQAGNGTILTLLLGGDNKSVCCLGIALHVLIGKYLDFNAWLATASHLYPIFPHPWQSRDNFCTCVRCGLEMKPLPLYCSDVFKQL